ncbi:MAG TPA: tRNA preQ1(34) S-adenosylmethionine ribosyltransferase-isomerase QueA [Anaerolineae bacterium]|nr:tRNA preQ1(34) S-adenosylmethionine ribosyltransferase-isomerase QueA [Anaerolineae bacterium]
MKTRDFDYDLPPELIAQTPIEPRDAAQLLQLDRSSGALGHFHFYDLPGLLRPGDLLVANESRVIPARIFAHKAETGGAVEILLLRRLDEVTWQALLRSHRVHMGTQIEIRPGLVAEVIELSASGERILRFNQPIDAHLNELGVMPLPPYIHAPLHDPERYQTIYSHTLGSAAAPTAGLHFTPRLLEQLHAHDVHLIYVTLHVGLDTFKPVETEDLEQHHIHTEYMELTEEAVTRIRLAKAAGRRVIAVGTTSVRVLETAGERGLSAFRGDTRLFIYPGFPFRVVDGLITNFHLPKSSLLMLVAAFAGKEKIDRAYAEAIARRYRFYSFGDAMLIL